MHCCHYVDAVYVETCNNEFQWSEKQERYLVLLYRQHPCLWEKDNPSYLDYYARRLAYEIIHEQVEDMGVTMIEVIMKIREVRRTYVEELRKMNEAETDGYSHKSEHIWFKELHNFLFHHLHCDEIEIIQAISKDSCCSSNYCDEEGESYRSCARESPSDEDGLSEAIAASKSSCCVSEPQAAAADETPLRQTNRAAAAATASKNTVAPAAENSRRRCDNLSTVRFASEVNWPGCESKTATAVVARRTKSNPEGGAVVCENEAIQPIRTDERSMAATAAMVEERQSSTQSCLTARKSSDQFDLFAKSIACQLRRMSSHAAAKVQMEIRSLLTNVPRDTESNLTITLVIPSQTDLSVQDSKDCNCHIILPYSQERNYISEESNLTVR